MAKHFVAVETQTGLPDSGKMFAVDPSAASGIALPSFKMVATLPRIGNIIGEGYFVTTSKTAFAWDGRVFQPVVPSAILTYPNDASVYADNTQPAGSYGASADTGHLFIMSQTGWRMVGSKTYANIAAANADTNVSDGALGWLTAEQVMIIRVGGAWQRIVDTPHVTVSATKPTAPITGDMVFNATTKVAEIYDGAAWSAIGGNITVSETAPATASPGAIWYKDSDGLFRVWVNGGWHFPASRAWSAATAPAGAFSGQLWWDTSIKALRAWDGGLSQWVVANSGIMVVANVGSIPAGAKKAGDAFYTKDTRQLYVAEVDGTTVQRLAPYPKLVGKKSIDHHKYSASTWEETATQIGNLTTYVPAGNWFKLEADVRAMMYHGGTVYLRTKFTGTSSAVGTPVGELRTDRSVENTGHLGVSRTLTGVSAAGTVNFHVFSYGEGGSNGDRQAFGNLLLWDLGPASAIPDIA